MADGFVIIVGVLSVFLRTVISGFSDSSLNPNRRRLDSLENEKSAGLSKVIIFHSRQRSLDCGQNRLSHHKTSVRPGVLGE
jgi:hypothetical protein